VVGAGQLLEVEGEDRRLLPGGAASEDWTWAADLASPPAIDGLSARAFLDWVARERGLTLRFETTALEAAAATTRLQGSIEGMTIEESLASVLPACGMHHRVEGGLLWIGPAEPVQEGAGGRE
jgi:hypothetical protein